MNEILTCGQDDICLRQTISSPPRVSGEGISFPMEQENVKGVHWGIFLPNGGLLEVPDGNG